MPAFVFSTGAVELFYGFRETEGDGDPGTEPTPEPVYYPDDPVPSGPVPSPYHSYNPYSQNQPGGGGGNPGGTTSAGGETIRWRYLGSAVLAPDVEAEVVRVPVQSDYNLPDAFQFVTTSEWHRVTATLNRLNFRNYNFLRNGLVGDGTDIVRVFRGGDLALHSADVQLFIRYAVPHAFAGTLPTGASRGRLYYSALLENYAETSANGRVQEATLLFNCRPLYYSGDNSFWLFTEKDDELPRLTPE